MQLGQGSLEITDAHPIIGSRVERKLLGPIVHRVELANAVLVSDLREECSDLLPAALDPEVFFIDADFVKGRWEYQIDRLWLLAIVLYVSVFILTYLVICHAALPRTLDVGSNRRQAKRPVDVFGTLHNVAKAQFRALSETEICIDLIQLGLALKAVGGVPNLALRKSGLSVRG